MWGFYHITLGQSTSDEREEKPTLELSMIPLSTEASSSSSFSPAAADLLHDSGTVEKEQK